MAPSRNPTGESQVSKAQRTNEMGRRPVKVASCSGYAGSYPKPIHSEILPLTLGIGDPSWQMLRQATGGEVDFITGDYLAGETSPGHCSHQAS
jgi:hypothetical protein